MHTPPPLVGETLAERYEVRRLVGGGRTGSVFAALDRAERRKVAIKVLHGPLCEVEEQLRRFEREFAATSSIEHPHTVRMFELGEGDGVRFLVMEFLEGRRLDQILEASGALEVRRVCRIAAQVASALAAAHAQDVVHRDLNPSNIMLIKGSRADDDRKEQVKVLDFGLARLLGSQEELTGFGVRLGATHYMAPEYIDHSRIDAASDLYALGCVMFEMLTGQPPFIGPSMKVLASHSREPAPAPSTKAPGLPEWLDQLVLRLLSKAPADRPTSAEVIEVLERHLASGSLEPEDPQQTMTLERHHSVITTGLGHTALPGEAQRTGGRQVLWIGLALQVVLVVMLLMGSTILAAGITWLVVGATP